MRLCRSLLRASAWLLACALLVLASDASAAPSNHARVVLLHPRPLGRVLQEAVLRTQGELRAVGLVVELQAHGGVAGTLRPEFTDDMYGALAFEHTGAWITMQAWRAGSRQSITQTIDTSRAEVNAEVVAIRAVESLRAVMLEFAKEARREGRHIPIAVSRFTRVDSIQAQPGLTTSPGEEPPAPVRSTPGLSLWLGAAMLADDTSSALSWGAQANVFFGMEWYHVGLALEAPVSPFRIEDRQTRSGEAEVSRFSGLLQLKAQLEITRSSILFAQIGGGVAHYRVDGVASAGFDANRATHTSPVFAGRLGGAYWFDNGAGIYLNAGPSIATNSLVIQLNGNEAAELDRRLLIVSGGVMFGAR